MNGMHGRNVMRVLGTVCVGASLLASGSSPIAAAGSTAASASGTATADASAVRVACRFRPSPGYQYGLSKEEQDYIYGSRDKCLVIRVHPRGAKLNF